MPLSVHRDKFYYVSGQLMLMAVTFLFNIVAAKLIGPLQMGLWQTISLISIYGMVLTLGVVNGMGRDVPYYRGQANDPEVTITIATTLVFLASLVVVFATSMALLVFVLQDSAKMVVVLGVALLCARMVNSFSTILVRSFRDFRALGFHQGFTALVLLVTCAPLVYFPYLHTVYVGVFISLLAGILISRPYIHVRPVSAPVLKRLLVTGFPIYVVGLAFILLTTIDRVIVLSFLGTEPLGLYTLASIAMAVLMMVPALVSNVMYPKLAEHYGATRSVTELVPMARRVVGLNLIFSLPVTAVFLAIFYFYVVPVYLDAYLAGRNAMAIISVAVIFLPIGASFGDVFNVVGMQYRYLLNVLVGLAINVCLSVFLISHLEMGLEGAAIGTVAGLLVFTVLQVAGFMRLSDVSQSA